MIRFLAVRLTEGQMYTSKMLVDIGCASCTFSRSEVSLDTALSKETAQSHVALRRFSALKRRFRRCLNLEQGPHFGSRPTSPVEPRGFLEVRGVFGHHTLESDRAVARSVASLERLEKTLPLMS